MSSGGDSPRIVSPRTTHLVMSSRDGISYITSSSVRSRIVRSPRAPACVASPARPCRSQRVVGELQLHAVQREHALVLLA